MSEKRKYGGYETLEEFHSSEEYRVWRRSGHSGSPNELCDHKNWTFEKHGRVCPCGVFMVDFGD